MAQSLSLRAGSVAAVRSRAADCRGSAAPGRVEVAAVRRAAAGARRQRQGRRQAMAVHAARIARPQQGGAAVRRAGRGERRRAADRESSRSRVRSVDVDAGAAARAAHRPAGSLDAILRHRLQLRRSRGARRRPVRLPAARRETDRRRACWRIESTPSQKKISQYTKSECGSEGHLRVRAGRELRQDRRRPPAEVQRLRAGAGHLDRHGAWR